MEDYRDKQIDEGKWGKGRNELDYKLFDYFKDLYLTMSAEKRRQRRETFICVVATGAIFLALALL